MFRFVLFLAGYTFRYVHISQKVLFNFVISVCLTVRISPPLTGRISIKFNIGDCYENVSGKFKFVYIRTNISVTLREDLNMVLCCH